MTPLLEWVIIKSAGDDLTLVATHMPDIRGMSFDAATRWAQKATHALQDLPDLIQALEQANEALLFLQSVQELSAQMGEKSGAPRHNYAAEVEHNRNLIRKAKAGQSGS